MSDSDVTVAAVVAAVHDAFPAEWAEAWDAVGLLAGDPGAPVRRAFVSLDVTADSVARALGADADVLVTHHPAFIEVPSRLTPAASGPVFDALAGGLALVAAHTNLDRAPAGAEALPALLGLTPSGPLEDALLPLASVTVYVPREALPEIESAIARVGAGRIGAYDACTFAAEGTGAFTPRAESDPVIGTREARSSAEEVRLETVCPRSQTGAVVSAIREAHPYEEPLIKVCDTQIARGSARMGRVCELASPVSLAEFARGVESRIGGVVRVRGADSTQVARVAVATGSASSLVGAALRARADVLVAGEVRYHDAVNAAEAGCAVIEVGHDVSEWPLVPVLAEAVRSTPGLAREAVIVDAAQQHYWTP